MTAISAHKEASVPKRLNAEDREFVRQIEQIVRQRWDQRNIPWLRAQLKAMLARRRHLIRHGSED